jgi:large subunit ribosomal protein L3
MLGEFRKADIEPKMRVVEFPITLDAMPVPGQSLDPSSYARIEPDWISFTGTSISAAHFVPGQHVDVQAPS